MPPPPQKKRDFYGHLNCDIYEIQVWIFLVVSWGHFILIKVISLYSLFICSLLPNAYKKIFSVMAQQATALAKINQHHWTYVRFQLNGQSLNHKRPRCMTKKVGHKLVYPKVEFLFCLERSICISFRKEKRTLLCPAKIELKKFKW